MKKVSFVILMMFFCVTWTNIALAEGPVVLKFASFEPPQSFVVKECLAPLFGKINKEGEGILKIETYAGGSLGRNPLQYLKILLDGVTDISQIVTAYHPGQFPDEEVFNTPFMADNSYQGSLADFFMREKDQLRGYEDIVVLGKVTIGNYAVHTTFPVKVPDDLKGKKMRSAGKMFHAFTEAFGATPVALPVTDVAESISRGVIGGTFSDWNAMVTFRIKDVAQYHVIVPLGSNAIMLAMTKKTYESLPTKARAILDKYIGEYFTRYWAEKFDEHTNNIIEMIKKDPKHIVYTPSPEEMKKWKAATDMVVTSWNKEVSNWDELIKNYEEALNKVSSMQQ